MSYIEIILLAFALSIDACVVSFTYGLISNENRLKNSLLLGGFTGLFQGLMPIAGYYLTALVKTYVEPYAQMIIFVIFTYLGLKFIVESFQEEKDKKLCLGISCLIFIGIATSIDAFSAGISLLLSGNFILKPAILIAFVTFINSLIGFAFGGKLKHFPSKWLEVLGGIILILLGLKAIL